MAQKGDDGVMRHVAASRTRFALAIVLGSAALATPAAAQSTGTGTGTSSYQELPPTTPTSPPPTTTSPPPVTSTPATTPTTPPAAPRPAARHRREVQDTVTSGTAPNAPSRPVQATAGPTGHTPTRLAYTGAEPLVVGAAGFLLLLTAAGLVQRRRST